MSSELASVRYLVDDVGAAAEFYVERLGFEEGHRAGDAFAEVLRGPLRLLLSGAPSSGARATPEAYAAPGCNRIHLVLEEFDATVERLRAAGVVFRSEVVTGPGGRQVLISDPAGNLVELFEPAAR